MLFHIILYDGVILFFLHSMAFHSNYNVFVHMTVVRILLQGCGWVGVQAIASAKLPPLMH
jgi:hypothetical protein